MSDRDDPPPRLTHSVQTDVALMHGDADWDCAGTANPAIRRSVCITDLSLRRFAVYPTPEPFSTSILTHATFVNLSGANELPRPNRLEFPVEGLRKRGAPCR